MPALLKYIRGTLWSLFDSFFQRSHEQIFNIAVTKVFLIQRYSVCCKRMSIKSYLEQDHLLLESVIILIELSRSTISEVRVSARIVMMQS